MEIDFVDLCLKHRPIIALLGLLFVVHCLAYIYRTSVEVEGRRHFLLWDDAMISMQYAKTLAEGDGLRWHREHEKVQGYTNLGITLGMAGLHLLPIEPRYVSLLFQLFSVVVLLLMLYLVYRLTSLLFPDVEYAPFGAVVLLATYGPMNIWALQGSDFAIQALILIGGFYLVTRYVLESKDPPIPVFLLLVLGVLVRPDFSLYYATILAYLAVFRKASVKTIVIGAAGLILVWVALVSFSYFYYSDPLPNTYYLKATGTPISGMLANGWSQVVGVFSGTGFLHGFIFVLSAVLLLRWHDKKRLLLLGLALVVLIHAYVIRIGGDWVDDHFSRFTMPAMPIYIIFLAAGSWFAMQYMQDRFSIGQKKHLPAYYVTLLLALAFSLNPLVTIAEWHILVRKPMYSAVAKSNLEWAYEACRNTTKDTKLAYWWAGIGPYFCDRVPFDLLGRTDKHIAKLTSERFYPGHSKWDLGYTLEEAKPDIIPHSPITFLQRKEYTDQHCYARRDGFYVAVRRESMNKVLWDDLEFCSFGNSNSGAHPKICVPCNFD